MVIFIDTSSLIKRYVEEDGSDVIDRYFSDNDIIYISPITPIEIRSALKRKKREHTVDKQTYETAIQLWDLDINNFMGIEFNKELVSRVIEIVELYTVKTLDAIQIGSCIISGAEECVTSDRRMYDIVESMDGIKAVYV